MKYIHTKYLEAILYGDGDAKLSIYTIRKSPYGWSPRELRLSEQAISLNEFTYDYVSNKVDEVYSTFPKEEIHELITKIKQENG
tara:strand:- start:4652 stop:4903 length:252 start_codon:yes stop_codon:yes gene_type:complete